MNYTGRDHGKKYISLCQWRVWSRMKRAADIDAQYALFSFAFAAGSGITLAEAVRTHIEDTHAQQVELERWATY